MNFSRKPLTVKELIAELQKLPQDLSVYSNDECWYVGVYSAKQVPRRLNDCRDAAGTCITPVVLLDS